MSLRGNDEVLDSRPGACLREGGGGNDEVLDSRLRGNDEGLDSRPGACPREGTFRALRF